MFWLSVECDPGNEDVVGEPEECVPCNRGFYKPDFGVERCMRCDNGLITPMRGATSLDQCTQGIIHLLPPQPIKAVQYTGACTIGV